MLSLVGQSIDEQVIKSRAADRDEADPPTSWIESHPATRIRIDSLIFEDSPRLEGVDQEHIQALAEAGDHLPPIIVHRPTMRVIDGTHRVRAALLNGHSIIEARLLDCDEAAAFVLSVKTNVTHGLPLSRSDRAAAAARIIMTHPQWSDRAVAAATALSDKTVSRIRARSTAELPQSNTRLGRDGRVRPLDSGRRREQAAVMIRDRPDAGLREVARATGLSPATVHDVRQRIDRGEDPVPDRYRSADKPTPLAVPTAPATSATVSRPPQGGRHLSRRDPAVDRQILLAKLARDPSLKFNEAGRQTLRWLHHHSVNAEELQTMGRGLPDHWAPVVADLARSCAAAWIRLAEQLQERNE
jgi:ParB-like chromosome segregation protein Spo0J